jgi:glycosyltransferase involved in cell wall biosynthesis
MVNGQYHIGHVLPSPFIGGTEHATLRIIEAVSGGQFTHTVFYPDAPGPVRQLFEERGLQTVSYTAVEPSYRHPAPFLKASFELARELKRRKVDLIHCADMLAGAYASLAGKIARVPVLCHIRCVFENLSRRDRSFLYPVDKFVFVSREVWSQFGLHVPSHRGTVIYDGVEINSNSNNGDRGVSVRRELNIPDNAQIVGMVARVTPAKDYLTLAKAAAQVVRANANAHFLIIGDYSDSSLNQKHYEEVKAALVEHGVSDHFTFAGHRPDVPRLLDAFDVSVLSTHTEGLPLVLLEAMAHGIPVLATAVGGVPEVIAHEKTGLLHSAGDADALASQILETLGNPERASQLGEAGREFVKTNFSRERFKQEISRLYSDTLMPG